MTRPRLRSLSCMECSRPWGVVLPRGHTDADIAEGRAMLAAAYGEWCDEVWSDDVSIVVPCPTLEPPDMSFDEVVFVSDASARWLDDIGATCDIAESDCWVEVETVPAWWAKSRVRTALRWDCCNLPDPRDDPSAAEIQHRHMQVVP